MGGEFELDTVSWLTGPGPWDIAALADRIADRIKGRYRQAVLVGGHSTGGAIALQLALIHPKLVVGLLLIDTGANTHGHGDLDTTPQFGLRQPG